jgi:hypothetical protein
MADILAVVDAGGLPDTDNLGRLVGLCADLPGELGNGQLLAWADASVPAAVPDVVFGVLSDAGLLADNDPMRWTNTDLTTWNPITQHVFDALVVGAGNGIVVTLIAFEGG